MSRKVFSLLSIFLAATWLPTHSAAAQEKPAAPAEKAAKPDKPATTVKSEAPVGAEDAPLAGADGKENTEKAERARRARLAMTVTAAMMKVGDKTIAVNTGVLKTKGPDYAAIAKLKPGEVLQPTRSQAIKLKTGVPLTFGNVSVKTENVAKGYAGVYSIWLKKTEKGWNFVFNQKPDVWGTMYDAAANVGEIPADYAPVDPPTEAFAFALTQESQGGTLKITWGAHQWSAKFTFAQ